MNSRQVATVAILGSLVAIISLTLSHYFRFPILPYLEFDPAEIIVMLSFLLFGPLIAILIEIIHFLLLNIFSSFPIIGPAAKSIAVFSTIFGYYAAFLILKKASYEKIMIFGLSLAILLRTLIMTLFNYVLFITIFAGFIGYASNTIYITTGLKATSNFEALLLILIFTGVYNIIHVFVSVIPASYMAKLNSIQNIVKPISYPWFLKFLS